MLGTCAAAGRRATPTPPPRRARDVRGDARRERAAQSRDAPRAHHDARARGALEGGAARVRRHEISRRRKLRNEEKRRVRSGPRDVRRRVRRAPFPGGAEAAIAAVALEPGGGETFIRGGARGGGARGVQGRRRRRRLRRPAETFSFRTERPRLSARNKRGKAPRTTILSTRRTRKRCATLHAGRTRSRIRLCA